MLSDQTNTKARRFSHEEGYTGSGISSTSIGVSEEGPYSNRSSNTVSFVKEDGIQMAKKMGRDTEQPGGSKPAAEEEPKETDRGRDQVGKAASKEIQMAGPYTCLPGSQGTGIYTLI